MTTNHISFVPPADETTLVKVDEFKWRASLLSETFEHTKVMWKGQHVLIIKKHVDYDHKSGQSSVLDDEYDEDDDFDSTKASSPNDPKIKWLLHTNWDWLKHSYGEFDTLTAAKAAAVKEVEAIMLHIRQTFMTKSP